MTRAQFNSIAFVLSLKRLLFPVCLTVVLLGMQGCNDGARSRETVQGEREVTHLSGIWVATDGFLAKAAPAFDPTNAPPPAVPRKPPAFREPYATRFKEIAEARERGIALDDPGASCIPPGMPAFMDAPYAIEIIHLPEQITIISEFSSQVRRIYMDGRGHPEELEPTYNGHSVGHWEGQKLLVETVGLRADTRLDDSRLHSDAMRIEEEFSLQEPDLLEVRIVVHDEKALHEPWIVVRQYERRADIEMMEYVCQENNRDAPATSGTDHLSTTTK